MPPAGVRERAPEKRPCGGIREPPTRARSAPNQPQFGPRDNARAESVIGLHKTEFIRKHGRWRRAETVEFATLTWMHWFNNRRLLEPIGNIPPAEAEERYYAMIEQSAMAA